jgi:hypothetical protein
MSRKFAYSAMLAGALFVATAGVLYAAESTGSLMSRVVPGMRQADVLDLLGRPEVILSTGTDEKGRAVEIWKYDSFRDRNVNLAEGAFRSLGNLVHFRLPHDSGTPGDLSTDKPYVITFVDQIVKGVDRGNHKPAQKTEIPKTNPPVIIYEKPVAKPAPKAEVPIVHRPVSAVKEEPPVPAEKPIEKPAAGPAAKVAPVIEELPQSEIQRALNNLKTVDEDLLRLNTEIRAYVDGASLTDVNEKDYLRDLLETSSVLETSVAGLIGMVSLEKAHGADGTGTEREILFNYVKKVKERFKDLKSTADICQANQRYAALSKYAERLTAVVAPLYGILKIFDPSIVDWTISPGEGLFTGPSPNPLHTAS